MLTSIKTVKLPPDRLEDHLTEWDKFIDNDAIVKKHSALLFNQTLSDVEEDEPYEEAFSFDI